MKRLLCAILALVMAGCAFGSAPALAAEEEIAVPEPTPPSGLVELSAAAVSSKPNASAPPADRDTDAVISTERDDGEIILIPIESMPVPIAEAPVPAPAPEEIVAFGPTPDIVLLSRSEDGSSMWFTGAVDGVYARAALILEHDGVTGLYVTQAAIQPDGTILTPSFQVPGFTVQAVNVAIVPTTADIQSETPDVIVSAYVSFV